MRSPTPSAAPSGFSLLELLVVLAILAAAGAATASRLLPSLSSTAATSTAAALASDLRAVRAAAETSARPQDVLISPDGLAYQLPGATRPLPPDTRLAGPPRLRFFADGSATPAELTITTAGHHARLRVTPLTARIETDADAP